MVAFEAAVEEQGEDLVVVVVVEVEGRGGDWVLEEVEDEMVVAEAESEVVLVVEWRGWGEVGKVDMGKGSRIHCFGDKPYLAYYGSVE